MYSATNKSLSSPLDPILAKPTPSPPSMWLFLPPLSTMLRWTGPRRWMLWTRWDQILLSICYHDHPLSDIVKNHQHEPDKVKERIWWCQFYCQCQYVHDQERACLDHIMIIIMIKKIIIMIKMTLTRRCGARWRKHSQGWVIGSHFVISHYLFDWFLMSWWPLIGIMMIMIMIMTLLISSCLYHDYN